MRVGRWLSGQHGSGWTGSVLGGSWGTGVPVLGGGKAQVVAARDAQVLSLAHSHRSPGMPQSWEPGWGPSWI